jgi:hypothetical protein
VTLSRQIPSSTCRYSKALLKTHHNQKINRKDMPSAKTKSKYELDKPCWIAAIAFDGDGEAEAVAVTTDVAIEVADPLEDVDGFAAGGIDEGGAAVVGGVVSAACVKVTRTSAPVIVCSCVVSNVEVTKIVEVTTSTMVVVTITDAVTELI